jgi:hypothetical protein
MRSRRRLRKTNRLPDNGSCCRADSVKATRPWKLLCPSASDRRPGLQWRRSSSGPFVSVGHMSRWDSVASHVIGGRADGRSPRQARRAVSRTNSGLSPFCVLPSEPFERRWLAVSAAASAKHKTRVLESPPPHKSCGPTTRCPPDVPRSPANVSLSPCSVS